MTRQPLLGRHVRVDLGVISIAMRRGPVVFDAAQTLRHELAHIALGAALGPDVPHWLQEGFAYQHTADWSMERAQTLAGMAWFGGVIPLEDLDRAFPAAELPANRAYAESYDFVGYLSIRGRWEDHEDDGNRWAFRTFLGQIAQGGGTDAAIERAAIKAYGRPLHDLFGEWRADLSRRYLLVPLEIFVAFIWIFSALLLTLAYWRKRRLNRVLLAQWDAQDRAAILLQQRPILTPEDVMGVTSFVVPPGHAAEDLDAQRGVTNTKSRGGTNL